MYCCALIVSSIEVVAHKWYSSWICAIIGSFPRIDGFTDQIMMGNAFSLITPFFHVNWGLKAAIHGYPSTMSLFPKFLLMKQSVAPESTSAFVSAIAL